MGGAELGVRKEVTYEAEVRMMKSGPCIYVRKSISGRKQQVQRFWGTLCVQRIGKSQGGWWSNMESGG